MRALIHLDPDGALPHATGRSDRRQKCRERGYYHLHRQLNDPLLLHLLNSFLVLSHRSHRSHRYFFALQKISQIFPLQPSHRSFLRRRSIMLHLSVRSTIICGNKICEICEDLCDLKILSRYRLRRCCQLLVRAHSSAGSSSARASPCHRWYGLRSRPGSRTRTRTAP